MTGTDWAYVPTASPPSTLLHEIVTASSPEVRADLLAVLGETVGTFDDLQLFGATADNLARVDGALGLVTPVLDGVEPLDRRASAARIAWHLAWELLQAGVLGADDPDRTVDDHAIVIGGLAGFGIAIEDVERFRVHEARVHAALRGFDADMLERDMRAMGTLTARDVAASELLGPRAFARALTSAYDELVTARRDRDAAEAAAVDAAASRALAQSLGEVLERDEWIRARLRNVKATKPARALIAARKRLLGRSE
jgi:hypothetical protein